MQCRTTGLILLFPDNVGSEFAKAGFNRLAARSIIPVFLITLSPSAQQAEMSIAIPARISGLVSTLPRRREALFFPFSQKGTDMLTETFSLILLFSFKGETILSNPLTIL